MEILAIANDLIFVQGQGLGNLTNTVISDWLGPAFIAIIAVIAITLAVRKQVMGFLTFALIAVIASLLIFSGDSLFGEKGNLSGAGKSVIDEVSGN